MTRIVSRQPTPPVPRHHPRRIVHGFKLPDESPDLTANEVAWLVTLRALAGDLDPPLTLSGVEALRRALAGPSDVIGPSFTRATR